MYFFKKKKNGNGTAHAAETGPAPEEQQLIDSLNRFESTCKAWRPGIAEIISELGSISNDTEAEFLAIGTSLQTFAKGCSESSAQASSTVAIFEGGGGFTISAFKYLFEHAHNEVESCAAAISNGTAGMNDLMRRIETILDLRAFLKKLSHSISVLGTLMKIETARVGEAEFSIMTVIVDELAREIEKDGDEIAAAAKAAKASLTAAQVQMAAKMKKFNKDLSVNKEHVRDILNEIDRITMQAKCTCERIKGRASRISPEVGNVISALQYHDICRQQMEHIGEALDEILTKISGMGTMEKDEKIALAAWTNNAIHIQIQQLEHVINETTAAAGNISSHLSKISDIAEAQSEDAGMLVEEEGSGNDRIARVGLELKALSDMLSESKNMALDMGKAVSEVTDAIGSMSKQVANIELISENIGLLALNTIIKVARTGEAGRGLEVLADEIRKISARAKDKITKGSEIINAILGTSSEFKKTLSEELNKELVSTDKVFQQTHHAVQELMDTDAEVVKSLNEISGSTKKLETDIMSLISGLRFAGIIKSRLGTMASGLRTMPAEIEANIPAAAMDTTRGLPQDLDALATRYTMHSERKVHQAALDSIKNDGNSTGSSDKHVAVTGNDLGDNVELF